MKRWGNADILPGTLLTLRRWEQGRWLYSSSWDYRYSTFQIDHLGSLLIFIGSETTIDGVDGVFTTKFLIGETLVLRKFSCEQAAQSWMKTNLSPFSAPDEVSSGEKE